jgi:cytochrome c biogenesis protein ResB
MERYSPITEKAIALAGGVASFVCSRRFVVLLLILIVTVCLASVLLPQQSSVSYEEWKRENPAAARFAEWSGFSDAFRSPLFLGLMIFLGLSLLISLFSRLNLLNPRHTGQGWGSALFTRRRLAGSLIFHAGLLGLLFAGTVSALTRADGSILVTEGQTLVVTEQHLHAVSPPRVAWDSVRPFEIRLDRFHPIHEGGWGVPDYASDLIVIENGREVRRATVRVNEPLSHRGVTFYQQIHGFSPLIVLRDENGRARFGKWVALNTDLEANPVRYADEFQIPGSTLAVKAELFPDAYMVGDRLASRSPDPNNPALLVTVREESEILYEGPVYRSEPVMLRAGLLLSLEGVRYWSGFETVRDSGAQALFWSAWIAVAGLCIRFAPRWLTRQLGAGAH